MSKKDEEHDDADLDDEEDRDEDEVAPAKPASRRGRPKSALRIRDEADDDTHDDHGHGSHGHDHGSGYDDEDPQWWTPYAAMSVFVVIGVLGFFGLFNKILAPIAAHPVEAAAAAVSAAPVTPPPPTPPHPMPGAAAHGAQQQPPGETFGAKHLLVQYVGSMRAPPTITRTKDQAKARAAEALKKAKGGAKFEDLVKEYSDEPNAGARGGDLGTFRKGQMVPPFQEAVEKLKVGEVSDIVETPFGYHVILRTK